MWFYHLVFIKLLKILMACLVQPLCMLQNNLKQHTHTHTRTRAGFMDSKLWQVCHWLLWFCCSNLSWGSTFMCNFLKYIYIYSLYRTSLERHIIQLHNWAFPASFPWKTQSRRGPLWNRPLLHFPIRGTTNRATLAGRSLESSLALHCNGGGFNNIFHRG